MHYIDSKGHKSELRCDRNYLISRMKSESCHWLHLYGLGGGQTQIHTHIHICMKIIQESVYAGQWPVCAWFNNDKDAINSDCTQLHFCRAATVWKSLLWNSI